MYRLLWEQTVRVFGPGEGESGRMIKSDSGEERWDSISVKVFMPRVEAQSHTAGECKMC